MARLPFALCLAALLGVCTVGYQPARADERAAARPKLVTLDFVNADLVYVIKRLGREMGRNVYIGPGVVGSVTVSLKGVPADGAVALILRMQTKVLAYKLVGYDTLIVATPEKVSQIEDDIMGLQIRPEAKSNVIRQGALPGH